MKTIFPFLSIFFIMLVAATPFIVAQTFSGTLPTTGMMPLSTSTGMIPIPVAPSVNINPFTINPFTTPFVNTNPFQGSNNDDVIRNNPILEDPTQWNTLVNQKIKQASQDGTIVYPDMALQCVDPDSAVIITVASTHDDYRLAFNGNHLSVYQLSSDYVGTETITMNCNGIPATFKLTVEKDDKAETSSDEVSLHVSSIRIADMEAQPGDAVPVYLSFKNDGKKNLKDVTAAVTIAELGIRASIGPFDLDRKDNAQRTFILWLPNDTEAGTYYVRTTINSESVHRVIHRDLEVTIQ